MSEQIQATGLEDDILETPELHRIEVARKLVDDETIYRYVIAYGNNTLGYIASSEEWFSPNRKGEDTPEFYEVLFQTSIHRTAAEALADALPSAIKEAGKVGVWQEEYIAERKEQGIDRKLVDLLPEPAPMPAPLNPNDYEITDGYVGSLGKTYKPATAKTLTNAIAEAAKRHKVDDTIIEQRLRNGESLEWCDSPNHYYDHSKGIIRLKRVAKPVQLVKCRCGHSVPRAQVMSASMGTSCPDCYDRMSA